MNSYHLSREVKSSLEAFIHADNQNVPLTSEEGRKIHRKIDKVLTHPQKTGRVQNQRIEEISKLLTNLNEVLVNRDITSLTEEEKKLVESLYVLTANPNSSLGKLASIIFSRLSDKKSAEFMKSYQELYRKGIYQHPVFSQNYQLSLAQAKGIQAHQDALHLSLNESQNPARPLAERINLMPAPNPSVTAAGSYRLRAMNNQGQMENLAIIKPAGQGLGGADNIRSYRKKFTHNAAHDFGMRPGQEAMGEHLTCTVQHAMNLPTNVPDTVTLCLNHPSFGSISYPRQVFVSILGFDVNYKKGMELFSQSFDSEEFTQKIYQVAYSSIADQIELKLAGMGIVPFSNHQEEFKEMIVNILKSSASKEEVFNKIKNQLNEFRNYLDEPEIVDDLERERNQNILRSILDELTTIVTPEGKNWMRQEGANLYQMYEANQPGRSELCSVQAWVPNCINRQAARQEDIDQMCPLSFGRIQLIDMFTVGRDRNTGNFMIVDLSREEVYRHLNEAHPGFGEWLKNRAETLNEQQEVLISLEEIDQLAEDLIIEWENHTGTKIPERDMETEWNVHFATYMICKGLDSVKDFVPIDHGLTFPDPEIDYEGKKSTPSSGTLGQGDSNNGWMHEIGAQVGRLPRRTRQHLASVDLRKEVLPTLLTHVQQMQWMKPAGSRAYIGFNENQQKLWFLSSRIQQLAAQENLTFLEAALIKDSANSSVIHTNRAIEATIKDLYEQHLYEKKLHEIDLEGLDAAILNAFENNRNILINNRV